MNGWMGMVYEMTRADLRGNTKGMCYQRTKRVIILFSFVLLFTLSWEVFSFLQFFPCAPYVSANNRPWASREQGTCCRRRRAWFWAASKRKKSWRVQYYYGSWGSEGSWTGEFLAGPA